jgi:hypothetical protein
MLAHRGAETATMVYEAQPMRDHFRRIDDKTVLGAMKKTAQRARGSSISPGFDAGLSVATASNPGPVDD